MAVPREMSSFSDFTTFRGVEPSPEFLGVLLLAFDTAVLDDVTAMALSS